MATIINPADLDKIKSAKLLVLSAQPVFYNTTAQFSISTKTVRIEITFNIIATTCENRESTNADAFVYVGQIKALETHVF